MKEILKHKEFMKLFIANMISRFGDSVDMIAYGYMVYKLTGSKMLLATIYIFNVMPNILFSTFSGTIVDFFSKKKIIIIGDVMRGGLVLITAFVYSKGLLETWHLFAVTFANSTIETFVAPCKSAVIPRLIAKEHYLTVNSSLRSVTKLVELIGLGAAGAIIGFIGIPGAMIIDAGTFIASATIILLVKFPEEEKKELTKQNYWGSYKEGLQFVFKKKLILSFILSLALINFFLTPIGALQAAYVEDILRMGPEGLSYFGLAFTLGGIIGGLLAGKFGEKIGVKNMIFMGLFFTGVFFAGLALPAFTSILKPVIIACISATMVGAIIPFAQSAIVTVLMRVIPKEMMARVSAVINMFGMSASPLGAFLSGIIVSFVGLEYLLIIFGGMIMITSIMPTAAYIKHSRMEKEKKISVAN